MLMKSSETKVMELLRDKVLMTAVCAGMLITAGSIYLSQNGQVAELSEMVQFSKLSNADIDNIIAIKEKMQAARIQANLGI